jgi:hypothetical protein
MEFFGVNIDVLYRQILSNKSNMVACLKGAGIIPTDKACKHCGESCIWSSDANNVDGFYWRCKPCGKKISIRTDTWLSGSKLDLQTILTLIYFWVHRFPQDQARFEGDIGSKHTSVNFYMFCREICYNKLEDLNEMLGGMGKVVEVDEAKFGRRKYNRGKRVEGVWVFGAI